MEWVSIAIGASIIFIFFGIRQRLMAAQGVVQPPGSGPAPGPDD